MKHLAGSDVEGTGFSSECWLGNDLKMKSPQMTNRNGFGLEGRCNKPLQLTNPFLSLFSLAFPQRLTEFVF